MDNYIRHAHTDKWLYITSLHNKALLYWNHVNNNNNSSKNNKVILLFTMSLQNLFDGTTPEELPRLRDDGMDSPQTLRVSTSQGPGVRSERISEAMTALAHRVGQLSSSNKRKVVAECHCLGIPGNMNVLWWVLQRWIIAHLNALCRADDEADDAMK